MKDPHLDQWKSLKERYSQFNSPEMKYRIKCIDRLIESAEIKEKEVNHFR